MNFISNFLRLKIIIPMLLVFFTIFPFRLFGILNTVTLCVLFCLPYVLRCFFISKNITLRVGFLYFSIIYVFLICTVLVSQLVNSGQQSFLNVILITVISYIVISIYLTKNFDNKTIYESIIAAIFVQCVIAIFITTSEIFRNYAAVLINDEYFWESFYGVRLYGLGVKSFPLGVNIAMGCIFLSFYIALYKPSLRVFLILSALFSLFSLSAMLSARSSLLVIIFSLLVLLIIKPSSFIRLITSQFVLFVLIIAIGYFYLPDVIVERFTGTTLPWLSEILNASESHSINTLQNMYIFPDNFSTAILGDGILTNSNGTYYMHSDVGYVRVIFYAGLSGLLIMIFLFSLISIISLGHHHSALILSILLLYFFLNMKGLLFFYSSYTFILILLASKGLFRYKEVSYGR